MISFQLIVNFHGQRTLRPKRTSNQHWTIFPSRSTSSDDFCSLHDMLARFSIRGASESNLQINRYRHRWYLPVRLETSTCIWKTRRCAVRLKRAPLTPAEEIHKQKAYEDGNAQRDKVFIVSWHRQTNISNHAFLDRIARAMGDGRR